MKLADAIFPKQSKSKKKVTQDEEQPESNLPVCAAFFLIFLVIVVALFDVDPVQFFQSRFATNQMFYRLSRDAPVDPAVLDTIVRAPPIVQQSPEVDVKSVLEQQLRGAEALREKLEIDKLQKAESEALEVEKTRGHEVREKAAELQLLSAKEMANKEVLQEHYKLQEQMDL